MKIPNNVHFENKGVHDFSLGLLKNTANLINTLLNSHSIYTANISYHFTPDVSPVSLLKIWPCLRISTWEELTTNFYLHNTHALWYFFLFLAVWLAEVTGGFIRHLDGGSKSVIFREQIFLQYAVQIFKIALYKPCKLIKKKPKCIPMVVTYYRELVTILYFPILARVNFTDWRSELSLKTYVLQLVVTWIALL